MTEIEYQSKIKNLQDQLVNCQLELHLYKGVSDIYRKIIENMYLDFNGTANKVNSDLISKIRELENQIQKLIKEKSNE